MTVRTDADSPPPPLLLSCSLIKVLLIALYYKRRLYRRGSLIFHTVLGPLMFHVFLNRRFVLLVHEIGRFPFTESASYGFILRSRGKINKHLF